MGFHEDDRIRNKNLVNNQAHDKYNSYLLSKMTNGDIITHCEDLLKKSPDNKVVYEVLKIAVRNS